jgi:hypothetical protein
MSHLTRLDYNPTGARATTKKVVSVLIEQTHGGFM